MDVWQAATGLKRELFARRIEDQCDFLDAEAAGQAGARRPASLRLLVDHHRELAAIVRQVQLPDVAS